MSDPDGVASYKACIMEKKTANTILRIFIVIWVILSVLALLLILLYWDEVPDNMSYAIQMAVSLCCSLLSGIYLINDRRQ